ncbi:hypothetical protein CEXT_488431 [Caerostris extrusa]|uniref:Uncharacterized protein n=1 Tax=Caerostris extrusa TaxID=172846 RepID=A0AAV4RPX7_CAEEX|nr:hypothetical protein CEXT_488431 [Caerostris extrusa]
MLNTQTERLKFIICRKLSIPDATNYLRKVLERPERDEHQRTNRKSGVPFPLFFRRLRMIEFPFSPFFKLPIPYRFSNFFPYFLL